MSTTTKLSEEQRETLIEALIEDWMSSLADAFKMLEPFLYEIFRYGRVGYEEYSDEELIRLCEEAGLEDALEDVFGELK